MLAFCIPLQVATPLAVLLSITVAAIVVIQDWRHIHLGSAGWLVASTALGVPLGLLVLTSAHQRLVRSGLGALILLFSVWSIASHKRFHLPRDSRTWLFGVGFLAGVLGGAYGVNGPPLVIYGSLRGWSPQQFRATLQAYFLPASLLGMVGYSLSGLWTPTVTHYYLISLPAMLPAVFLGRFVNRRLHPAGFLKFVYLGLAGIGLLLLIEAIAPRI